jgi:hypothetical protein
VKLTLLRILRTEADARSLGSLHFAYWVVVARKQIERLKPDAERVVADPACRDQMLFLSDFSGDWEVYLVGFNRVLLAALDFAWGNSVGWKNNMQLKDYLQFVRKHELPQQYYFSTYETDATVEDVRCAMFLSEELDRFVFDVQGCSANDFADAFKQLLIRLGKCLVV